MRRVREEGPGRGTSRDKGLGGHAALRPKDPGNSDLLCLRGGELCRRKKGALPYQPLLCRAASPAPFPTLSGAIAAPGESGRGPDAAAATHQPSSNLPGDNKLQSLVRKVMKTANKN